jgi:hypothetical protein
MILWYRSSMTRWLNPPPATATRDASYRIRKSDASCCTWHITSWNWFHTWLQDLLIISLRNCFLYNAVMNEPWKLSLFSLWKFKILLEVLQHTCTKKLCSFKSTYLTNIDICSFECHKNRIWKCSESLSKDCPSGVTFSSMFKSLNVTNLWGKRRLHVLIGATNFNSTECQTPEYEGCTYGRPKFCLN